MSWQGTAGYKAVTIDVTYNSANYMLQLSTSHGNDIGEISSAAVCKLSCHALAHRQFASLAATCQFKQYMQCKLHNCCISAQYIAWVVCACMQAECDKKGLDIAIHPIPKCVIYLEDLLQELVAKKSKDPFGTIRVARKAF